MLSLKKGTYSGKIVNSICDDHIISCITSYHEDALHEKMHYHQNPHISFVMHGGNLEKRKNKEITRQRGKITFYYSGEFHQSTNIVNFSRHVNLEIGQQFLTEYEINENVLSNAVAKNPDASFLLLHIYKELTAADKFSAISIRMLLLELINNSLHFQENQNNSWIKRIDEILRNNWNEPLSLKELSAILNMHPVTVSRQFHKYFSCTLGEYLRKLKIEKALTLINSTHQSLTEIAFDCGFADQSHFTRTFKQLTGFLPHVYQKL